MRFLVAVDVGRKAQGRLQASKCNFVSQSGMLSLVLVESRGSLATSRAFKTRTHSPQGFFTCPYRVQYHWLKEWMASKRKVGYKRKLCFPTLQCQVKCIYIYFQRNGHKVHEFLQALAEYL